MIAGCLYPVKKIAKYQNIHRVYIDKTHDNKTNFNLLDKLHLQPLYLSEEIQWVN